MRPTLDTGDIVLMSGSGRFSSLIKSLTGSGWSHVAMIVRRGDRVHIWESSARVELGDMDEQFIKPELAPLSMRLGPAHAGIVTDPGDVAVRRLSASHVLQETFAGVVDGFISQVAGRPYETSYLELLRARLGESLDRGNVVEALDSFFCSELVAETYQHMGLLPGSRPSNTYRPRDFSLPVSEGGVRLMDGASLGPVILLEERCA